METIYREGNLTLSLSDNNDGSIRNRFIEIQIEDYQDENNVVSMVFDKGETKNLIKALQKLHAKQNE